MTVLCIFGASSGLGMALLAAAKANKCVEQVWCTYRTPSESVRSLMGSDEVQRANGATAPIWRCVDVQAADAIEDVVREVFASAQGKKVCFVYCCGRFSADSIASVQQEEWARIYQVGVFGPARMMAAVAKNACGPAVACIVSGLNGSTEHHAHGVLYSGVTAAVATIVSCAAQEKLPRLAFVSVCIGLVDKGQALIRRLREFGYSRISDRWQLPVEMIEALLAEEPEVVNGSVVKLTGGCLDYRDVYSLSRAHVGDSQQICTRK
jgi:NAD(P)-dependent dehydrogenase (short-subunit alcohol dehydrogenase family)